MKYSLLIFVVLLNLNLCAQSQTEYPRVRKAHKDKDEYIQNLVKEKGIDNNKYDILITAYKKEEILQVWIKPKTRDTYEKLISYDFCNSSGVLGPKRQSGDLQIPEGFYYISYFNPASSYYLSLKVSYPNQSDRILGVKNKLGGDIFIHGACCTIGCIPITDDKIMELYVLCLEARSGGQKRIPVYIFPAKLDTKNFDILKRQFKEQQELIDFWTNIKEGYELFCKNKKKVNFSVNSKGKYIFK